MSDKFKEGLLRGGIIELESKLLSLKGDMEILQIRIDGASNYLDKQKKELNELMGVAEIDPEILAKLTSMVENYPEYSTEWIYCSDWSDYRNLEFKVEHDEGEFRTHRVSIVDLIPTYEKFGAKLEDHYDDSCEYFDMEGVDYFMQCHFFGRAVYG